jgi:hypothetical protein
MNGNIDSLIESTLNQMADLQLYAYLTQSHIDDRRGHRQLRETAAIDQKADGHAKQRHRHD